MVNNERKKVDWVSFSLIITVIFICTGYLFSVASSTQAQVASASVEMSKIQVQLSQIQTDLQWIKLNIK